MSILIMEIYLFIFEVIIVKVFVLFFDVRLMLRQILMEITFLIIEVITN